jgi:hypothetical protein
MLKIKDKKIKLHPKQKSSDNALIKAQESSMSKTWNNIKDKVWDDI